MPSRLTVPAPASVPPLPASAIVSVSVAPALVSATTAVANGLTGASPVVWLAAVPAMVGDTAGSTSVTLVPLSVTVV